MSELGTMGGFDVFGEHGLPFFGLRGCALSVLFVEDGSQTQVVVGSLSADRLDGRVDAEGVLRDLPEEKLRDGERPHQGVTANFDGQCSPRRHQHSQQQSEGKKREDEEGQQLGELRSD